MMAFILFFIPVLTNASTPKVTIEMIDKHYKIGEPIALNVAVKNTSRYPYKIPFKNWLKPQYGNLELTIWKPGEKTPVNYHYPLVKDVRGQSTFLEPGEQANTFLYAFGNNELITDKEGVYRVRALVVGINKNEQSNIGHFEVKGEIPGVKMMNKFSRTELNTMSNFSGKEAYGNYIKKYPKSPLTYYLVQMKGIDDKQKRDGISENPHAPRGARILSGWTPENLSRKDILERIDRIEKELRELRNMLEK